MVLFRVEQNIHQHGEKGENLEMQTPKLFLQKKTLFNAKENKRLLTRGPARLYLLVNQPYRCPDRTRLPALFQNRFKERVENMAMPKGGFESGAGALGEWRIAQGNKQ